MNERKGPLPTPAVSRAGAHSAAEPISKVRPDAEEILRLVLARLDGVALRLVGLAELVVLRVAHIEARVVGLVAAIEALPIGERNLLRLRLAYFDLPSRGRFGASLGDGVRRCR